MTIHPEYVVDTQGNRQKVLLPIEEFHELVECAQDVLDHDLIEEVRKETPLPWDKVKKKRETER